MCGNCYQNCQACWSKHFYHQYMEQHSAMMQWFYQMNQYHTSYVPNTDTSSYQQHGSYLPSAQQFNTEVNSHSVQEPTQWIECNQSVPVYQDDRSNIAGIRITESSSDELSSDESDVSRDDIIGSEDEIYFDPDCFLQLSNDEDSLTEKSDDDSDAEEDKEEFEIIDSVIEEFEYVQLDKFGNMSENRKGRKGRPNAQKEMETEREVREYLYGEKADTIAGLETAMSLDFNRLCDLHQPHLWPVLPVRLSKA